MQTRRIQDQSSLFAKLRELPQKSYLRTNKSALRQSYLVKAQLNIGMDVLNEADNDFNHGDDDDDGDDHDHDHVDDHVDDHVYDDGDGDDFSTRSLLCLEFRVFSRLDRALHHHN